MPCVIGIDEVGRGCLAGPITVAAVAAEANKRLNIKSQKLKSALRGIKDSKKLSPRQREEWYQLLTSLNVQRCAISSVGPSIIDRIGISRAAKLAVGRCLRKLKIKNKKLKIQIDGSLYAPRTYKSQETIIGGDERIPLIAAASIVAKVTRDRMMARLHRRYPLYGLAVHKGYGTNAHCKAIAKHGLCEIHRRSYCATLKI